MLRSARYGTLSARFIQGLMILSTIYLCAVTLQPAKSIFGSFPSAPSSGGTLANIDKLFEQEMQTGDIFVRFDGFDPERAADKSFMTSLYFRGNYLVHPRRLYVAHRQEIVNDAQPMVQPTNFPFFEVAEELNVEWLLNCHRSENGQIQIGFESTKE